jgi:orotate phosphoribosyltransferase-like protein
MFTNWIDKTLQKIDRENVAHLLSEGGTTEEISRELNMSRNFVEDVAEEVSFIQERNSECQHND